MWLKGASYGTVKIPHLTFIALELFQELETKGAPLVLFVF